MLKFKYVMFLCVITLFIVLFFETGHKVLTTSEKKEYKTKVVKLNDKIHFIWIPLGVVLENEGKLDASIDKVALKKEFPNPAPVELGWVDMEFLVPGSSGLSDPSEFVSRFPNSRDSNIVNVYITSLDEWQLKKLQPIRSLNEGLFFGRSLNLDLMGMKCEERTNNFDCGIEIRAKEWASVSIEKESLRRNNYFPQTSVNYITAAYGGLYITWSTDSAHRSKIREIDQKLWDMIAKLNLLETK